jgi:predicted nuclease of predicted toxin-antitoxin system
VKFIADINISPKVVATLRASGHDVTRCDTFLPSTAEDHEIAALASKQGAAIITRDQDFAAILAMARASAPSIVNVRLVRTDARSSRRRSTLCSWRMPPQSRRVRSLPSRSGECAFTGSRSARGDANVSDAKLVGVVLQTDR